MYSIGQNKAQAGFEGSQEARGLREAYYRM